MSDISKLSNEELMRLYNETAPTSSVSEPAPTKEPIGFLESIPLGFKKASLGITQSILDAEEAAGDALGLDTSKIKELKKDAFDVEQQYREKGEGSGFVGGAGEFVGQMASPVGILSAITAPASGTLGLAWQGAKLGAATGLTAPLEEGQSRIASGAIGAGAGAVLTPLTAKATAVLAKKANQSFNKLIGKSPKIKTADELNALAKPLYDIKEAAKQTALKPSAYGKAGLELEKIATPAGYGREKLRESGGDAVYNFYQNTLLPFAKREITLDDFDVIDDQFQKAIEDVSPNKLLGKSGDKSALGRLTKMRQIFHDTIQSAPDDAFTQGKAGAIAWRQADRIKAAEYAMRDLDALIQKSMDKDQPAKAIQTGLAQILNSPRYAKAFNAKEKELMRDAIKTGVIGEGLRALGSRLGALGIYLTGGLEAGLAATAGGALTREAAEAARVKGIDTVKQAITSRAIGTPMPVMPNVGVQTGAQLGKAAAIGAAQGIAGQRGTPPEPTNTGLESLSDEELINLLNQGGSEPTRINIAPPVNGQDPLQGTQGVPDVQLPATIPDTLPQHIKENEGYSPISYKDTTGNTTVGHGINLDSGIARKAWKQAGIQTPFDDVYNGKAAITPQESAALGNYMMRVAVEDADAIYPKMQRLSAPQQEALTELAYNLGRPRLAGMRQFNEAINKGDKINAVRHLMRSKWVTQVGKRRARQIASKLLMET